MKRPENHNKQFVKALAESLQEKGMDIKDFGGVKKASSYQTTFKNKSGEMEVMDLWSFDYEPMSIKAEPLWPVLKPGPVYHVPAYRGRPRKASKEKTTVIIPDAQIGFYRDRNEQFQPTHDDAAIAVAMGVIYDLQPDQIICVGDNIDFPEMGKYRTTPAFQQTTQASIDRASLFASQLRSAAPHARIVWLAGNHEERLPNYILDNAVAAFGLKKGNSPSSWPLLSVPTLCNFDEHKIEYLSGYPAGEFWINDSLKVIHGTKVKSNANTAHAYLRDEKVSVIYGHIHRIETAYKTRRAITGSTTVMAASAGCLARVDGSVPSTKGSKDLDGRPIKVSEDWQQGIAVVTHYTNSSKFGYEVMPIINGWGMFRGNQYTTK